MARDQTMCLRTCSRSHAGQDRYQSSGHCNWPGALQEEREAPVSQGCSIALHVRLRGCHLHRGTVRSASGTPGNRPATNRSILVLSFPGCKVTLGVSFCLAMCTSAYQQLNIARTYLLPCGEGSSASLVRKDSKPSASGMAVSCSYGSSG